MFKGPEHASYIALMRERRLERVFEEGDWYQRGRLTLCHRGRGGQLDVGVDRAMPPTIIWLPRLDQLLAMLEEMGKVDVHLGRTADPEVWFASTWAEPRGNVVANGRSREEVVDRLRMAVRGA